MKTNKDKLAKVAVNGKVDHPRMSGFYTGYDGKGRRCVGTGGITYSHAIGDNCMDVAADHLEPGVTIAHPSSKENHALETLACIGNQAKIVSGAAKGKTGWVTGTHGGVEHTMIYMKPEDLDDMDGSETFLIKAFGQGLKLEDYPDIFMMNIDPDLLEKLPLEEKEGVLTFPVTHIIPAYMMGAGLGTSTMMEGDYDIMTQDREAVKELGLDDLRFGDFVAIQDQVCTYGPHYQKGAMTIGVIVHSDSFSSGHGPGVTVVATAKDGSLDAKLDPNANLKNYLG
jgi:hypothetical protein